MIHLNYLTLRSNLNKLKQIVNRLPKRTSHLSNKPLKSNTQMVTNVMYKGYLLHPFFYTRIHNMFNSSVFLIGPNLSPYKYNITNQVLHKIKSLLSLDSEDFLKYIVRLPAATLKYVQPKFYNSFLKTVGNHSVKRQTKIITTLCNYHKKTQGLTYKTIFKNVKAVVTLKKLVRPYLFLNAFQQPSSFMNKTVIHKFLKFSTPTRFIKRQKSKKFARKRGLFKTTKRVLKNVSLLKSYTGHLGYLTYTLGVETVKSLNINRSKLLHRKFERKKRKQIFIRKKYTAKAVLRSTNPQRYLYSLYLKTPFSLRKRFSRKVKHSFIKPRTKLFTLQANMYIYNVNTLKFKLKFKRIKIFPKFMAPKHRRSNHLPANTKRTIGLS